MFDKDTREFDQKNDVVAQNPEISKPKFVYTTIMISHAVIFAQNRFFCV